MSWLRNLARGVRDIFDANTEEDQRKRLAAGQPRRYETQQVNRTIQAQAQRPQYSNGQVRAAQMGIKAPSYGNGLGALWNATKDTLWDANTAQDMFKRNVAALNEVRGPMKIPKLNETYIEQQDRLGNRFAGNNVLEQTAQGLLGGTSAIVKTGKDVSEALQRMNQAAGAKQREGTLGWRDRVGTATANAIGMVNPVNFARMPYDQLKGYLDPQGSEAIAQQASQELNKDLDTRGIAGTRSMVNSKEAKNLTPSKIAKTATTYGIKSGTEVLPLGKGYQAATNVVKGGAILKPFLANAVGDFTLGSAGSAVDQYIQTGKIDPRLVAQGGALSTVLGAGGFGLGVVKPKSGVTPEINTRVARPNELAVLSDLQDINYGRVTNPTVINQTMKEARVAGKRLGIDVSTGSPADINARITEALSRQRPETPKKPLFKPMNEGGYVQLPGGKKGDVVNPEAPDFLQVKKTDLPAEQTPVFNAPETPGLIRKPTSTSNAPQGAGVIPLDKLGKETATEAPQRLITGKARKDAVVQNVLESVSKQRGKSGVEGSLVAGSISRKAKELGIKLDRNFIDKYQTGKLDTPAERQMAAHIKQETDNLFLKQQALDPTIQYRQNYVPQSYDNTPEQITAAVNKLEKSTGASKRRVFSTYAEAEKFGLKPKNITLDQMIGESAAKAEKVAQNVSIVNKGLAGGIFTTETKGVPLAGIISPDGKQLYANKEVADILNGVLQKDSQGLPAAIGKVARAFETSQDIMLQGGIPGTNANFFVAGQAIKDTTRNIGKAPLHPIQAVKQEGHLLGDLFRGKSRTQKRFTQGTFKANGQTIKNSDFVRAMADRGLYIQPQTGMADLGNSGLRTSWNTLGNKPTFGRYMPNRMLSTAQEVYSQSVKKVGHQQALKLAADTVKTFNGHVDTILKARTNLTNDMMGVALFAPKYRESIINALGNVVKSVYPTKWADKSYAPSRQLLAGMAVTLGAYEMLNRQLSGHSMMDNRPGQELSVEVPYGEKDEKGNQKVINIPFMPGFMTIPRAGFNVASNVVSNARKKQLPDAKKLVAEVSKVLSSPIQTGGRVLANEDYFGRPIYMDEKAAAEQGVNPDNPLQAFAKIGAYVAGQNSPSWVRAAIDKVSGKPTEQAIATALEAPVRFGKKLNPATEAYFNDVKDVRGGLNKNDQAVWDTLYPPIKKNVNGEYITDKTVWGGAARAANLLNNPDVLEAATEMARRAKERGEKVDPLFGQLKGEQQLIALTLDTLPPKDPQKTALKNQNPWYDEYYKTRQAFFDGLPPGDPNKPKAPIAYPEPSQQLETIQKAYYQLEDSTMKRKMLEDNPELVDQMAKEEQYSRAVRAAKNLPQYDKYPEAPKDVQNLIDFYSALPKGEANGKSKIRSAWIKSHPAEWAKMTDQFSRQAQYNLQRDASLAAFEGEDLTERGIKSITSLAKSLGMEDGGSGGYSSGGRYARGGGGGGRASKPQIPDYSSIISSVSGLQKKVTGAKVNKVSLKNKVKKPSTRRA